MTESVDHITILDYDKAYESHKKTVLHYGKNSKVGQAYMNSFKQVMKKKKQDEAQQ